MKIVCDIDGVIADPREHIMKYLPDWDEYYKHTLEVPPIKQGIELILSLWLPGNDIFFVSGRPEYTRDDTEAWLAKYLPDLRREYYSLILRPDGATEPVMDYKIPNIASFEPDLIIEDEPRMVDALVKLGYVVLQMHGFRITGEDAAPFSVVDMNKLRKDFKRTGMPSKGPAIGDVLAFNITKKNSKTRP